MDEHITDRDYYPLPEEMDEMKAFTDSDYRDFGDDQGHKWDEGFDLDCLVSFQHEGRDIVNPYSYTTGDPAALFGAEKMSAWKAEAAALMAEWEADAA